MTPSAESVTDADDMLREVEEQAGLGSLGGEPPESDENDQLWATVERMRTELDELQRQRRLFVAAFLVGCVLAWCFGIWAAGVR
jgi:hypothetical protein